MSPGAAAEAGVSEPASAASSRDRILDAACEVIAEVGIDEVRIARIARAAGVSTALVHYHFDTREALLGEALEHSFELAGAVRMREEGDDQEGGTAARRLADAIDSCLPWPGVLERDWVLWVELWLRAVRNPTLQPVAARLYERYRAWLEKPIAEGVRSGEFERCDPGDLADRAMALVDGYSVRALLGDPAMDLRAARTAIGAALAPELGLERLPFARRVPS
ncbi:MAG: TetR/AcrR family transcriptional regulator [Solirubrobacteraceae bacterium]